MDEFDDGLELDKSDEFFSINEGVSNNKPTEVFDEMQYDLTDYSDNSSSNHGSYQFHEEDQEDEEPGNPKMFQLFGNVQLNYKDEYTLGMRQAESNTQETAENLAGSQSKNSYEFNPFASQASNTMGHDYAYYLKQNNVPQLQSQMSQSQNQDALREKRLSKLIESPTKQVIKAKRLYCNHKVVPVWAADLDEIQKQAREQKNIMNPNQVFGHFSVDNLDLVQVFQRLDNELTKPRYFRETIFLMFLGEVLQTGETTLILHLLLNTSLENRKLLRSWHTQRKLLISRVEANLS
jgi:hypothetical protein